MVSFWECIKRLRPIDTAIRLHSAAPGGAGAGGSRIAILTSGAERRNFAFGAPFVRPTTTNHVHYQMQCCGGGGGGAEFDPLHCLPQRPRFKYW